MSKETWREKYRYMHTYIDTLMERETDRGKGWEDREIENVSIVLDSHTSHDMSLFNYP